MGGKSRKTGAVSRKLINRLKKDYLESFQSGSLVEEENLFNFKKEEKEEEREYED